MCLAGSSAGTDSSADKFWSWKSPGLINTLVAFRKLQRWPGTKSRSGQPLVSLLCQVYTPSEVTNGLPSEGKGSPGQNWDPWGNGMSLGVLGRPN